MHVVELDGASSTEQQPYGIITADCSSPKEIDDGLFVEQLDASQELYRVGVCVADTSRLYTDRSIFEQAMANTEAKYWQLPNGEIGYDPMIETEAIRELEFTAGATRRALIISFLVGKEQYPTDVNVSFGQVEVLENLGYKDFHTRCRDRKDFHKFGRVGSFILGHLKYTSGGDGDTYIDPNRDLSAIYNQLMNAPSKMAWSRGSRINEAFMVGAGHLVGTLMAATQRPAIYRVHDPTDTTFKEFIHPSLARYSAEPGLHSGLNLRPYCRVTSGLRRLEDFMMCWQLLQFHENKTPNRRDRDEIDEAVKQLNRRVVYESAIIELATQRMGMTPRSRRQSRLSTPEEQLAI